MLGKENIPFHFNADKKHKMAIIYNHLKIFEIKKMTKIESLNQFQLDKFIGQLKTSIHVNYKHFN